MATDAPSLCSGTLCVTWRGTTYILSTKVGRYTEPAGVAGRAPRKRSEGVPFNPVLDYTRDGTLRSLEQSLLRLGTARIDIVYIHDVDAHSQGSDEAAEACFRAALAGSLPALQELKRDGVISAIGIGLNQPHWALRWLAEADLDAVMLAGRLTLLNREAETAVLDACARRGVAYVAAGAFNGGLLARGGANGWRFNYRPASDDIRARYATLRERADRFGIDLKAAAIQFPLRFRNVASLVIGASTPDEVEENLRLATQSIPPEFWEGAGGETP